MVSPGDRLCVAVSGGPDSTALLLALHSLGGELGVALSACHINHGLRGNESDGDEQFVLEMAAKLSIPCTVVKISVKKYSRTTGGSMQSVARELRYLVFKSLIRKGKADKIAIAHTADDSAETFLLNLLRGSGPQGLSGIPPVREAVFIRPLIETRKREILLYLEGQNAAFRVDSSNASSKYRRNRIRNELLPLLEKEFNPSASDALGRTAEILGEMQDFMAQEAAETLAAIAKTSGNGEWELDCHKLAGLHTALQREVVRQAIATVRRSMEGISFENLEGIRRLALGEGGRIALRGVSSSTAHGVLYLSKLPFTVITDFSYPFPREGIAAISETGCIVEVKKAVAAPQEFDHECETVYLDADSIPDGALLRNRRDGDIFTPLGASGGRKLKKFFIDEKVPRWQRDSEILLAHGNEVLWIAGRRLSDKVRLTPQTRSILQVRLVR